MIHVGHSGDISWWCGLNLCVNRRPNSIFYGFWSSHNKHDNSLHCGLFPTFYSSSCLQQHFPKRVTSLDNNKFQRTRSESNHLARFWSRQRIFWFFWWNDQAALWPPRGLRGCTIDFGVHPPRPPREPVVALEAVPVRSMPVAAIQRVHTLTSTTRLRFENNNGHVKFGSTSKWCMISGALAEKR